MTTSVQAAPPQPKAPQRTSCRCRLCCCCLSASALSRCSAAPSRACAWPMVRRAWALSVAAAAVAACTVNNQHTHTRASLCLLSCDALACSSHQGGLRGCPGFVLGLLTCTLLQSSTCATQLAPTLRTCASRSTCESCSCSWSTCFCRACSLRRSVDSSPSSGRSCATGRAAGRHGTAAVVRGSGCAGNTVLASRVRQLIRHLDGISTILLCARVHSNLFVVPFSSFRLLLPPA